MARTDLPSNEKPDMRWILEAKELKAKGFFLSIETGGIDNQVITLKAFHERFGSVTIESWIKNECPLRFNWMERAA